MAKDKNNIINNLENPVFTNLDILIDKTRTKLITFSFLAIFISHYSIDIEKGLNLVGITVLDITVKDISIVIFFILVYMIVNFGFMCQNRILEYLIRRTGTKKEIIESSAMSNHWEDKGSDEKQASLYFYWNKRRRFINEIDEKINDLDVHKENYKEMKESFDKLYGFLNDERIFASLKKFDDAFWNKIKGENFRWFMFDFVIPLSLGLASSIWIFIERICN